ncbi:hypothetical protein J0X15_19995, partial [Roseibium sp. CAU 1637]
AQQVISGDKLIERHNLERCLGRAGLLQHQNSESKKNRQTPGVCQQSGGSNDPPFSLGCREARSCLAGKELDHLWLNRQRGKERSTCG